MNLTLYLVTDPHLIGARSLTDMVAAAVQGGVTMVQIRDKHADDAVLARSVAELRAAGVDVPILVNDSVTAARCADGVHLGQSDEDPVAARRRLGPRAVIGLSTSTAQQVRTAGALPAGTLDYLAVGPVWPTATKPDAAAPVGPTVAATLAASADLPMVAIGGIGPGRVRPLRSSGLAGVCVVSAICAAPDPAAAAAALRAEWAS